MVAQNSAPACRDSELQARLSKVSGLLKDILKTIKDCVKYAVPFARVNLRMINKHRPSKAPDPFGFRWLAGYSRLCCAAARHHPYRSGKVHQNVIKAAIEGPFGRITKTPFRRLIGG